MSIPRMREREREREREKDRRTDRQTDRKRERRRMGEREREREERETNGSVVRAAAAPTPRVDSSLLVIRRLQVVHRVSSSHLYIVYRRVS